MNEAKVVDDTQRREALEKALILEFFKHRREGFFVEVGANDPINGSQTWLLERNGWRGLLVEPQSAYYEKLLRERPASKAYNVACSAPGRPCTTTLHIANLDGFSSIDPQADTQGVSFGKKETVRVSTLDDILATEGHPKVDFVSIDVEGHELEVLQGFSLERYHPTLILVEDTVRNLDKHRYLTEHGYRLVKRTTMNNWYVPKEADFQMSTIFERLELFRKMHLATPLRQWRLARRRLADLRSKERV